MPEPMDELATLMLSGRDKYGMDLDHLSLYAALEPFLAPVVYVALGAALELCPVHHCDIQICLDDEVHGQEVYEASQR